MRKSKFIAVATLIFFCVSCKTDEKENGINFFHIKNNSQKTVSIYIYYPFEGGFEMQTIWLETNSDTTFAEDRMKWGGEGIDSVRMVSNDQIIALIPRQDDNPHFPKSFLREEREWLDSWDGYMYHYTITDTTFAFVAKEMMECYGIDVWRKKQ